MAGTLPRPTAARQPLQQRYDAGVAAGQWQEDPAQLAVLPALERLALELSVTAPRRSLWERLAGQPIDAPQGVYLWGPVGRGKTFLVDLFFDTVELKARRRVHYHHFMRDVHARLNAVKERSDPLEIVAGQIAGQLRLLCVDEFIVDDIGDAMILGNLLRGLFARGVVLVMTSNTAPRELYRDGLQREQFLPAIDLLEEHCDVVELASDQDWRQRALHRSNTWHVPHDAHAMAALEESFAQLAPGSVRDAVTLDIHGRALHARRVAADVVWFDFAALCEGPRAVADYLEIAQRWAAVIVSDVPRFTQFNEDAARRFVELVDAFYDHGTALLCSAAAPMTSIYQGERLRDSFGRTESRLIHMQSLEYLGRAPRSEPS